MKTQHRPMLNPATHKPVQLADLEPVFCTELAKQELNETDRYIDIPGEVREHYRMFPSVSADACILSGKSTGYAGKNLLQI